MNGTGVVECGDETGEDSKTLFFTVSINILVFLTVAGISSVVDISEFKASFRKPPIYAGAAFQFFLMPLIGFITVTIFPLEPLSSVTLLILCASPGGSFSNWWCNLFNADLALSVSMTSLSTIASIAFLPLNILLYVTVAYERTQAFEADSVEIEFVDLAITLAVVISGILIGLFLGATFVRHQTKFNIVGNVAGISSIILGAVASADTCDGKAPWEQAFFPLWVATAFPLIVGLVGVMLMTGLLKLTYPQRVAIALETAYQNTGIALSYSLSQGALGRSAAGVPVIYGGYEAGFFGLFMLFAWKRDWTYAPKSDSLWKVMFSNYQPGGELHKSLYPAYYKEEEAEDDKEKEEKVEEGKREEKEGKTEEGKSEEKGETTSVATI